MSRPDEKRTEAIQAVKDRVQRDAIEFFHDPLGEAFATVPVKDHRETWRVRSRHFKLWIMQTLFDAFNSAPRKELVNEIQHQFEMHAICRGVEHEVYVRVAERDGTIYLDLVNDRWQAIEITPESWRILDEAPVKFRRQMGMAPLPYPKPGKLRELLTFLSFIDAQSQSEQLVLSWISCALRPGLPYPILDLSVT